MINLTDLSVNDIVNNSIICNSEGQDPRRVSEHIWNDFFGFDIGESTDVFMKKLERGEHPFQQH